MLKRLIDKVRGLFRRSVVETEFDYKFTFPPEKGGLVEHKLTGVYDDATIERFLSQQRKRFYEPSSLIKHPAVKGEVTVWNGKKSDVLSEWDSEDD